MDLTLAVTRYRECARHVWNAYFQPMEEGWHEFIDVESALFSGLVLEQFKPRDGLLRKHPDGYFEAITVIPSEAPRGLPVLHVREAAGQANQWSETRLDGSPIDLRFIEFFDFASYNSPHDFKWVRARVVGPPESSLIGEDLLVEFEYARFEGLTA